jgi:hypothetical protein
LLQHRTVNKVKKPGLSEAISDGKPTRQPLGPGSLRFSGYWPPNVRFGSKADIKACPSALPPKADMDKHGYDIRFVPLADMGKAFTAVPQTQQSRWPG